jgi:hypothetical protein
MNVLRVSARVLLSGLAFLLGPGLLLSGPAEAAITNSRCVGNLQSPLSPGNSCTANDVTFILVGLGDQTNGCVNTSDTVSIYLGAKLQNTTGFTRYDIGMFIYDYLGAGDPTPNAFGGLQCAVEALKPVYGTVNTSTCGPLNLAGGSGPFFNAEGDTCGDLVKGMCNSSEVFMKFSQPITIPCLDSIGANGSTQPDGFVDIPTCATWGNSENQVGPGGTCTDESTVHPGTGSKCNCATVNSDIPLPRIATSCTCSPTPVRPGQSSACTVSFTNTVPNCTATAPTSATPERFECGTGSFMRFKVGYNAAQGQVLSAASTPAETTGGGVSVDAGNSQVVWTPRNNTASGTSLGVIGPNESGSMTYQFYVNPSVASGTTINQAVTLYWSNTGPSGWANEVAASAQTVNCSFQVSNQATWARISSFGAREEDGRVAVEWETAAEVGTVAFEVERRDPATGRFVKVGGGAVPAVQQLPGGRYRLIDPAAPRGQALTYRLVEVDGSGAREVFGPYRVAVKAGSRSGSPAAKDLGRDFVASGKAVSPRLLRAVETAGVSGTEKAAANARGRAKVLVARSGLVRVRTQDFAGALGLSIDEAGGLLRGGRLRLSHGGQEVAWQADPAGGGLVFYGEAIDSPYSDVNVYWLESGAGRAVATVSVPGSAAPAAPSFADTLHLETDAIPGISAPLPVSDFWIWKSFFPGYPGFDRATFPVEVPAPAAGAATLSVNLQGFADSQRAALSVNGRPLGEIAWSGSGPYTATVALPSDVLRDGANSVEIVALEAPRGFWLDSFDLAYPHLYRAASDRLAFRAAAGSAVALSGFRSSDVAVWDVASPLAPRRLGVAAQPRPDGSWGASFVAPDAGPYVAAVSGAFDVAAVKVSAPADLRNSRGAQYLVIAPAAFRDEAQRLADLRSAQGLSSLVVDLGDVMDLFGDGLNDPLAIRRFLAYAVQSWSTPPRYVALAGKGTYDYKNRLGLSTNLVPPYLLTTESGIAPADAELADFDGGGVPAVAVGRIPAVTAADLRAYVDKVAAYESTPGGAWTGQALLVADDADLGGDFPATSDALAGTLAPGLSLTRVYLPVSPNSDQVGYARSQLQGALRQGQALLSYVGHGGLDRLTSEGLLTSADVPGLGNGPRLPVMTALTCLISEFAYPSFSSLGEDLVLRKDGGVSALFGPTWLSHNAPAGDLGRYLLPVLSAPGGGRLGDRLLRGLSAYAAAVGDRQMLRLYTLLGDPALGMKR